MVSLGGKNKENNKWEILFKILYIYLFDDLLYISIKYFIYFCKLNINEIFY